MYLVQILELDDILLPGIWCRPRGFRTLNTGSNEYSTLSDYGTPINNFKWIPIEDVIGAYWLDGTKRVIDFQPNDDKYEFIRGIPSPAHRNSIKEIQSVYYR